MLDFFFSSAAFTLFTANAALKPESIGYYDPLNVHRGGILHTQAEHTKFGCKWPIVSEYLNTVNNYGRTTTDRRTPEHVYTIGTPMSLGLW